MKTIFGKCFVVLAVSLMVLSRVPGADAADTKNTPKNTAQQGAGIGRLAEALKLTPEQTDKLSKNREDVSLRAKDLREKLLTAQNELKAEFDKPGFNKAKIDSLTADIKSLVGRQIQNRIDGLIVMKQILSPEQFTKITNVKINSRSGERKNPGNPAKR